MICRNVETSPLKSNLVRRESHLVPVRHTDEESSPAKDIAVLISGEIPPLLYSTHTSRWSWSIEFHLMTFASPSIYSTNLELCIFSFSPGRLAPQFCRISISSFLVFLLCLGLELVLQLVILFFPHCNLPCLMPSLPMWRSILLDPSLFQTVFLALFR
jgi:hypothetical protein